MDLEKIVDIFGLKRNSVSLGALWELAEESKIEVPNILRQYLYDLSKAGYEDSEATSRLAIDLILIQARKHLLRKLDSDKAEPASLVVPSTPTKGELNESSKTPKKPTKIFPESTVSIEIPNPSSPNGRYLVHGRADWSVGYSPKSEDGGLLVAIEAKKSSTLSQGEAQLTAYLAILRENRLRAGETNAFTQGFYSDGRLFGFVCIKDDGTLMQSLIFDTKGKSGLQMTFSFIVAMLETAMKSTPTATPTKPGEVQDKEVSAFEDEVWSKWYAEIDECIVDDNDDDDMTDVMFIPADGY